MHDYIESLRLPSDKVAAYLSKGYVYLALKEYQKGLDTFHQALEVNSAYADAYAYQGRGLAYFYLKQKNKSLKDFETALNLFEEHKNMSGYVRTQLLMKSLHGKKIPKNSIFSEVS
jgi:tetratricopeptide (TPR) repeat protein